MKWQRTGSTNVKLNLKTFFMRWGRALVKGMRTAIMAKQDINGGHVQRNAKSTVARKGFDHRGIHTGATRLNGFKFNVAKQSLTLFGNTATHPSGNATYDDIIYYNQPSSAAVPGDAPSGNNPGAEWFGVPEKALEALNTEVRGEVIKQLNEHLKFTHTLEVTL